MLAGKGARTIAQPARTTWALLIYAVPSDPSRLRAADASRRASLGESLPSVHLNANYGEIGRTVSSAERTYTVAGSVTVPIVIRMEGTNVEEGKRLLEESGLKFTTADSMGDAAERVVSLATSAK